MTKPPAKRITSAILAQPWAITEGALRLMLQIAERKDLDLSAVEARKAERLENTSGVGMRDGVAIVPVIGPIARYMNLFSDISGGTSIQSLARDFQTALNNTAVKAILLNIDSPGGEVNGVNEFANMVYAARGVKPITAYVGGTGASAAYWIASAADEIVADETALLGSIGVIAALPADEGTDVIFVSSQSPHKRPDPATEEGAADIQAIIDATAQVFVESVARNRGISSDDVLTRYGAGGVLVGSDAVRAGLADRLGAFEATLAGMQAKQTDMQRVSALATPLADAHPHSTPLATAQAAKAAVASLLAPSGAGGPRSDTQPKRTKEHTRMTEELIEQASADPPGEELSAEDQARIERLVAMKEDTWRERERRLLAEAEARFERRMAEERARTQIEAYAQHVTSPTLQRPYALPIEAATVATFLSSLTPDQRTSARSLFDRILTAGLVSFEEIGSEGAEAEEQSAKERFDAAVTAKTATGKTRYQAIQEIQRESADLYAAYQAESSKRGQVAAPAKKGGK